MDHSYSRRSTRIELFPLAAGYLGWFSRGDPLLFNLLQLFARVLETE